MKRSPTVLYVLHNIVGRHPFGGIEVYEQLASRCLREDYNILRLVPKKASDSAGYQLIDSNYKVIDTFDVSRMASFSDLTHVELETIFTNIIRRYDVSIVHFQHFMFSVPSLPVLAKALGARCLWTAHDYYVICRHFNLTDNRDRSCLPHLTDTSECNACLARDFCEPRDAQQVRRNAFSVALLNIDAMIFPSRAALDIVSRVYPLELSRSNVTVLGQPTEVEKRASRPVASDVLNVAVYGNFSANKGAETFLKIFQALKADKIRFHLFGRVDQKYAALLATAAFANVISHGPFSPGAPPDEIRDCAVSMHLSSWPETFCMTLSEAWQLGLVPIVTDIGALGERVEDGVNGFKVPVDDAGASAQLLRRILNAPASLTTIRQTISQMRMMTPSEHASELSAIYRPLLPVVRTDLAGQGWEKPPFNKVATLRAIGLGFFPSSTNPVHAAVAPSAHGALPMPLSAPGSLLARLIRVLRRHGIRYTVHAILVRLARRLS